MSNIRLFISERVFNDEQLIKLNIRQTHYLKHVMRLKIDQQISIFNGEDGEWSANIEQISNGSILLRVVKNTMAQPTTDELFLCFPLVKWNALRNIIRQATELGVTKL